MLSKEYATIISSDLKESSFDYEEKIGSDYIAVLVNNEFVYRFPRKLKLLKTLHIEKQLLDIIKNYVSFQVPELQIIGGVCLKYNIIKGESFDEKKFKNLSIKQKDKYVKDIVFFMKELHGLPVFKVKSLLNKKNLFSKNDFVNNKKVEVENRLRGQISKKRLDNILNYIDEYYSYKPEKEILIHSDLGLQNIIFNNNKVAGIIDFTNMNVFCLEREFMRFVKLGDDILIKIITLYLGKCDKEFLYKVKFLWKINFIYKICNDDYILGNKRNRLINKLKVF